MFCPKCGEKSPDGVAFCPKCGNKFAAKPSTAKAKATTSHDGATVKSPAAHAAAPSPAKPAISAPSVSLDTNLIVPLAIGVIALILAFMPWFSPSADDFQTSQYISDGANNLSSFFGGDSTAGEAYRLKSSYTMLELGDYADTMSAYGSSGIGDVQMLTICWAIPVIISVIGLIMAFLQKKTLVARIGFALLAIVAAIMALMSMSCSGPIYPALCCIASFATAVILRFFIKE